MKDIAWFFVPLASFSEYLLSFFPRVYPNPTSKVEIKGRYAFDKVNPYRRFNSAIQIDSDRLSPKSKLSDLTAQNDEISCRGGFTRRSDCPCTIN